MQDYVLKFEFISPLRIGREDIDLQGLADGLHSDTLFSALCHVFVDLYGQAWLEDFIRKYQQKPFFILSSAFPYFQNDLFLPRPFKKVTFNENQQIDIKAFKDLKWVSPSALLKWLESEENDVEELIANDHSVAAIIREFTTPRVALDRVDSASNIYYCSQVIFAIDSGLFVIVRLFEDDFQNILQGAMDYLGDCGLGSERNNGYGRFKATWNMPNDGLQRLLENSGDSHYLLSLYNPADLDDSLTDAHYSLIQRRGYFYSRSTGKQYKRCSVWMLQEGSILAKIPKGKLVDVTPSICGKDHHRIYRNGIPFTIQFKGNNL